MRYCSRPKTDRKGEHGLEKGAYLYICGDAKKMAKEVDAALHEIVEQHGFTQHPERSLQAKEYIKCLKKQKRYLRDVY